MDNRNQPLRTPEWRQDGETAEAVSDLLDAIPALVMDSACADAASGIRRALEESGNAIVMADSMIAGIVASNGGALLTRNRKHFERIAGLRLA